MDEQKNNSVISDQNEGTMTGQTDRDKAISERINDNSGNGQDRNFMEETAAELTAPSTMFSNDRSERDSGQSSSRNGAMSGKGIAYLALALSILSLFMFPVLLGAAGIIIGFVARRRGNTGLGSWAIGIGAISLIIGMFVLPFF